MLDQLFQMIQESSQQAVVQNTEVPNEHNEAVMQEAQSSIINGLNRMVASGQINGLLESFERGEAMDNAHPAVQQISNNFMGGIMEKFGINSKTAASIAAIVIPLVLSKMMNRNNPTQSNSGGSFDLGGLLSSLTGGNQSAGAGTNGGIMDVASSIGAKLGLDKDGDGDVDMSDITKML